jgi:hypothetical protein
MLRAAALAAAMAASCAQEDRTYIRECEQDSDCTDPCPSMDEVGVCSIIFSLEATIFRCECGRPTPPPPPPPPPSLHPTAVDGKHGCGPGTDWCPGTSFCVLAGYPCPESSHGPVGAAAPNTGKQASAGACMICVDSGGYYASDGSCSLARNPTTSQQCFDNGRGNTAACCSSLDSTQEDATVLTAPAGGAQNCPPGAFMTTAVGFGQGWTCQPCPAGQYQPLIATMAVTECELCAPGKFAERSGAPSCVQCPQNFYSGQSGSTTCQLCRGGTLAAGATECK